MKLIDMDALLRHLADYQLQESPNWGANGWGHMEAYEAITNCIKAIEEAPVVMHEKPERKKGRWLVCGRDQRGYADTWECSECGSLVQYAYRLKDIDYDFCPHCGAEMKE